MPTDRLRLGYLVSRFPTVTETFVFHELDALSELGVETIAGSLFPGTAALHPAARRWASDFYRPTTRESLAAFTWWAARKPQAVASSVIDVLLGYGRHPAVAVRALVTLLLAAAHARRFQQANVQHVHAHWATYPALAAWLCRRLTGIPYSFTVHSHDLFLHQLHLSQKAQEAEAVLTVSGYTEAALTRLVPTTTPVEVIRCGLDLRNYAFRRRTPPASGPISVVCVASFREVKGHRYLLQALATFEEPFARMHLDLVGDGPLRVELEQLARELGIAKRVTFRGALSANLVVRLLDSAHIFVLPSVVDSKGQTEGLPLALIEALAVGVPTIGTRVGGVPELIKDGVTGLLATPRDVGSLREALRRTVDDEGGTKRRIDAGRKAVEAEFDAKETAGRLLRTFKSFPGVERRGFSPERYWSTRLAEHFDLRGTGHLAHSHAYNRWMYRAKEKVLHAALDGVDPVSPALDIGSGTGWVVTELAQRNIEVEGCDITDIAVERLRERFPRLEFFRCSVGEERIPRPGARYALVTMIDVAYHIVDDDLWRASLLEISRVLRRGGHLIVTDTIGPEDSAPSPHVRFRSERSWLDAAEEVGLELKAIRPLYRWLSRERAASILAFLPGSVRGAIEYGLEKTRTKRSPHTRCATFIRQ